MFFDLSCCIYVITSAIFSTAFQTDVCLCWMSICFSVKYELYIIIIIVVLSIIHSETCIYVTCAYACTLSFIQFLYVVNCILLL